MTHLDDARQDQSEASLIAEARAGDLAAFGTLIERHQSAAYRVAISIAPSAPDAQDAVQEAFIRAYKALGRFRPEAPFRPWLMKIVVNEAKSVRRTSHRRERLTDRVEALPPPAEEAGPEADALSAERRETLLSALASLSPDHRLAVVLRYFLDMSEADIAIAMGVAPGTVKSRLSRALARLRIELSGTLRDSPDYDEGRIADA